MSRGLPGSWPLVSGGLGLDPCRCHAAHGAPAEGWTPPMRCRKLVGAWVNDLPNNV